MKINKKNIDLFYVFVLLIALLILFGVVIYKEFYYKDSDVNDNQINNKIEYSLNIEDNYVLYVDDHVDVEFFENIDGNKKKIDIVKISASNGCVSIKDNKVIGVKSGSTLITVYGSNNIDKSVFINVLEKDKSLLVLDVQDKIELNVGDSKVINAYILLNGKKTEANVSFNSSNETVATIDIKGNIKAIKEGDTIITAKTENNLTSSVVVKVISASSVRFTSYPDSILVGKSVKIEYEVLNVKNPVLKWNSSNEKVLQVLNDGTIVGKSEGKATITLTVGKNKVSCEIEVRDSYNAFIEYSSSINTSSQLNQTLFVRTTDARNILITKDLSYKWYKDNSLLSNSSDNLKISQYGNYKVDVYKNNKLITSASYVPNASKVSYSIDQSSDTKFVFVNNPEVLKDEYFVDKGNVINKTSFDKNIELYFEHNRGTSTPFYYGVRIYNPNNRNVTLRINRSGISATHNGLHYDKTWYQYYTGNVTYRYNVSDNSITYKDSYVLSPGQYLYLWLVKDDNMLGKAKYVGTISDYKYEPYNDYLPNNIEAISNTWAWAFDGVLNLTATDSNGNYLSVTGSKLEVSNIAVSKNYYKKSNKDNINQANNIVKRVSGSTITGEYNGKNIVTNNINFVINDYTKKGTLPTYYSTISNKDDKSLMGGWVTNITGVNSKVAYQRETISLVGIDSNGNSYMVKPFSNIVTANYAVHYNENITITNNSSRNRNVAFYVNTGSGTETQSADKTLISFVTNGNKQIINNQYNYGGTMVIPNTTFGIFSKRTNIQVWKTTIPPNTTITIPSIVLVGGMSYGNLIKMVCVDNQCNDAFYQNTFDW